MYDATFVFAYNDSGYGNYTHGVAVRIESESANTEEEALSQVADAAKAYAQELAADGYEMPYPWCWGDVVNEVPDSAFEAAGVKVTHISSVIICDHDEVVVSDEM